MYNLKYMKEVTEASFIDVTKGLNKNKQKNISIIIHKIDTFRSVLWVWFIGRVEQCI